MKLHTSEIPVTETAPGPFDRHQVKRSAITHLLPKSSATETKEMLSPQVENAVMGKTGKQGCYSKTCSLRNLSTSANVHHEI